MVYVLGWRVAARGHALYLDHDLALLVYFVLLLQVLERCDIRLSELNMKTNQFAQRQRRQNIDRENGNKCNVFGQAFFRLLRYLQTRNLGGGVYTFHGRPTILHMIIEPFLFLYNRDKALYLDCNH